MTEIVEFIEAQLAEDQAVGEHLLEWTQHPAPGRPADTILACTIDPVIGPFNGRTPHTNTQTGINVAHVADPARILADVAAKRAVIELYNAAEVAVEASAGTILAGAAKVNLRAYGNVLHALAAAYSARPGFKPEWRLP